MFLKPWIASSLNRKFAAGTAAGLLMSSLVFLVLYMGLYRAELGGERELAAQQVNQVLRSTIENAMLKRDIEGLRFIVEQLGLHESIERVLISDPRGEIRFSSDASLLGQQIRDFSAVMQSGSEFYLDKSGNEVLRSVNPIKNKPACYECHGSVVQNQTNGVLFVDYDTAQLSTKAHRTTFVLMGSGAIIVVINLLGGWWFMQRFVLEPIYKLGKASTELAKGELSARVNLKGKDELAQLGSNFDQMAGKLESAVSDLEHQKEFLQSLIDAIPDGLRVIDQHFQILLTNRTYRALMGTQDSTAIGQACYRSSHHFDEPCAPTLHTCPIVELRKNSDAIKVLQRHRRGDGSTMDVEIYAAVMSAWVANQKQRLIVESIRDLEPQVKYSHEQRLSELGRLATGVAHEIYNPLASVRLALHSSIKQLNEKPSSLDTVHEYLELVDHQVDKCIEVTNRLLKLAAPPSPSDELVDLNGVVHETLSLLRWEAEGKNIAISIEDDANLRILGNDSETRIVVLNLAQNAFHSMTDGGKLTVVLREIKTGVELTFKDTGVGIEKEDQLHIFDPFFSRRADGTKGTGLGLSITRNIVQKFGGVISVNSEVGVGSVFTLVFPEPLLDD